MGKARLGFKIGAGFSAVILLAIILGGISYYFVEGIGKSITAQNDFGMPVEDITTEMSRLLQGTTIGTVRFLAYHDYKYLQNAFNRIAALKEANLRLKALQDKYPAETAAISKDTEARQQNLDAWEDSLRQTEVIARRNDESMANVLQAEQGAVAELQKFMEYMEELLQNEIAAGQLDRLNRRLERKAYADQGMLLLERSMKHFWTGVYNGDMEIIAALKPPLEQLLQTSEKMLADSNIPRNIENLKIIVQNLQLLINTFDVYVQDGRALQAIIKDLAQSNQATQTFTDNAFDFANNFNAESNHEVVANVQTAERYMIIVAIIIVVAAIIIGLRITRMVQRPVQSITQAFAQMANKDFRVDIKPQLLRRNDELGELVRDLSHTCQVLSDTINEVRYSSEAVNNSAQEIAQGNNDLNNRTQQQAAAVEQIASALTQMTSSVRDSASNSQHANQLAAKASNTAQQGGDVVTRTVTAMQEVTESSKKINEIINVVNEIAFQTNLLALNAAVEAARAGEAGKGFAVVAGEVRNLAGRSAEAAKQIQSLISDTVNKVEQGNSLVAESGRLLTQIIDDAKAVVDNISEVSSASQEQANTIEEINRAMNQMDSGIQQNAAMVEQISSATESLNSSASATLDQVNQFVTIPGSGQALLPAK